MLDDIKEPLPEPFIGVANLEDIGEDSSADEKNNVACTKNPNVNDDRRLFQVKKRSFSWNPSIPYDSQPNRLEEDGPVPLIFPDHFLEVQGGVVII